jgi:hypothetical protein
MQQAFINQINIMQESLLKDQLPRAVVNGFISMICNAAHRDPPFYI